MCGTFTGSVGRVGLERLILGTMLSCPGELRARPLLKVNHPDRRPIGSSQRSRVY
jgi:hypothetical protein